VPTVRRILLVVAALLVLAGAFGSVVGASAVGAADHGPATPTRSTPADPRLCTIGQRCAPSAPVNSSGPVSVPGTLAILVATAVLVALPRRRLRVGRRRVATDDFTPGIFRPPIAGLA